MVARFLLRLLKKPGIMAIVTMRERRRAARVVCFLIFGVCLLPPAPGLAKDVVRLSGWDLAIRDSLDRPTADPNATFRVRAGAEWKTDVGTYRFHSGTLTFLLPVGGRPTGCYFEGAGQIDFTPPSAIERGQLFRFCADSSLAAAFEELYICYFDSLTNAELAARCDSAPLPSPVRNDELRDWQERINDDLEMYVPAVGWRRLLRPDMPHASLIIGGKFVGVEPLYFMVDDADDEAVSVYRRSSLLVGKGGLDLVCSYDRPRTAVERQFRESLVGRGLAILDYHSEVTIRPSTEMVLDVTMRAVPHSEMRDLSLLLAPKLEVDTVWINGAVVPFLYSDGGGGLVARPAEALRGSDAATIRVLYRGTELLYKFPWGDFFISYTTSWLPVTRPLARADYETTFRFPKHYDLVSSGEIVSDTVAGDWRIKKWRTYDPAAFISFNYGSFDVLSSPMVNGPRLDIYRSRNHLQGLFGGDIKKAVAADIDGSIQLFRRMFGPYPWPQLAATEIPGIHGQGFPQLLHLAWYSFETSKQGITDAFRAHEVAHQWFGHLVGWATYHDQWLSEGFAEYAGALYVQARNPGDKTFLELVKQWRSSILDVGGYDGWHAGPDVAPIWLGVRCASSASPASYSHLVYSKGAYVLHMLRNMLHDYKTGSDERFAALMRDYVSTYAHDKATTEDFQRIVERHLGQSMQWFFDQWVYGVQIPRYEYRWERTRSEDGKWIVKGRIDQLDVVASFRVYMPITLVFDDGRRTFVQEVTGTGAEFTTPPLTEKPKEVMFNDYMTVLCREKLVSKP